MTSSVLLKINSTYDGIQFQIDENSLIIPFLERNRLVKEGGSKKEDGTDDRRRRVDPPNQPKHPGLKPHIHKPGEKR